MRRGWWIGKFIVFGLLMVTLFGLVTQFLWNWLVPVLFTGPMITFWQALGLLALSKILFSGFGRGGRWGHYRSSQWKPYWKEKMKEKMAGMTPEERERLKERMKEKWCSWEDDATRATSSAQKYPEANA